ncbi:MAG TPA: hypothetical protein VII06_32810 [Chloroflexota bacterium]|jgi:hypothetical protein
MTREIVGPSLFAGLVGAALLGSVLVAGANDLLSAGRVLAGTSDSWPSGACESTYTFDVELGRDRPELVCWTNDFSLSVPEPSAR